MKKYEILDTKLTEDNCRDIAYYGQKDGYYYKDYELISEIRDEDGNLAAKIHNNASEWIKEENE